MVHLRYDCPLSIPTAFAARTLRNTHSDNSAPRATVRRKHERKTAARQEHSYLGRERLPRIPAEEW